MARAKLNIEKIKQELPTANEYLEKQYGKEGTPERDDFNREALAYYYGELIKEKRKEQHLTQEQLAERVGKKRAYISRIEKGETDLQVSNFVIILRALGLSLNIQ